MKLLLKLENPQKLALLLEFLKDITYIKEIEVIDNNVSKKTENNSSISPLVINPDRPLVLSKKPKKKNFSKPILDTKLFKFNREELNER